MSQGPISESLKKAEIHKEAGNALLKKALALYQNDPEQHVLYTKALREYHNANLYLRSVDASESKREGMDDLLTGFLEEKQKKTKEDKEQIQELKCKIWNNMSLIYHKINKPERVIEFCRYIINIRENDEKALLKLVNAYIEIEDYENAEECIKKLSGKCKTDDKEIEKLKKKINTKRKITDTKLMSSFKNYSI